MKFGFLIDNKEFGGNDFKVSPLHNHKELIEAFYETMHVSDGWMYGPEEELKQNSREKVKFKLCGPKIPCSHYYIVPTHEIFSSVSDDDYLRFLILGSGFLQGLYLNPEKHLYIGRTPYLPGKLIGLNLYRNDYKNGMNAISNFYKKSNLYIRNGMFAAIHLFLISKTYIYEWDKFDAQYKVLDCLFSISGCKKKYPTLSVQSKWLVNIK